jgi:hypothetical protein
MLGAASSDDGKRLRWQDVAIFRTEAGKYIASRVGRTVVFHALDGCGYGEVSTDRDDDLEPCPVCGPDLDAPRFRVEQDRFTAHVSETPQGIIESLTSIDADGVSYRPRVVQEALREAAGNDRALKEAMSIRLVS